nr:hypothetical protein [Tanacetum cinerariifolium]
MDIRDEIKLSKGDMLSDSDQNKHRNKLPGVKAIDRVSSIKSKLKDTSKSNFPIKSKLKDTGKSNSPKSKWVPMSERVFSPQSVTQYNPITGEVRKESEKVTVVKKNSVVSKSKVAAVVSEKSTVVNESVVKSIEKSTVVKDMDVMSKVGISNVSVVVSEKSAVDDNPKTEPVVAAVESVVEKDNPKVTSKVSDESVKESVKVPVVKKSVKASSVVTDKPPSENQDKIDVVADKRSSVVAEKVDVVVKKSIKASSLVADKPSSVVTNKVDVVKDKVDVVKDKGKKPVVGKDKDKPKNIMPDVVKEKFKPNPKQKVISSEIPVLRLSKQEENPEVKAKVNVKRKMILSKEDDRKKKLKGKSKKDLSDFKLETDAVDYSSDEVDRKRKKLKIKAGLKRKRSGSDSSDSSKIDTKSIKLLISKLEKKVKKQESDEDSVPKKFKNFFSKKVKKEVSDEESLPKMGDKIEVTPSKIRDMLDVPFGGYSLFDLDERETDHEFVRKWAGQFYPLELKKVCVNDIARKLIAAQEIDFLFKVNFLTLFTNTMDSTKFDKFSVVRTRPTIRNWSSYLMKQRQELKLKDHVVGLLDLHDEWNKAEVQESEGFIGFLKTFEKEFVALHEKYVNLFKDPISFEDDGNEDNVGDDDDENVMMMVGDKDPNGSNLSFGFSKISLEDFGNDSGPVEKDKAVEGNLTEQGTVVEGNEAEEGEIMSTPENFTQWLEKNVDLVGEGDLFGDNSATLEAMNQEITPEKLPTQKGSPSPKKRVMKPSSYLLSPYMNKKTNVVPIITRLEFILGNSLFVMQGDKIENIFEAHFGMFVVYGVRLNLETLAPGLWLDANSQSMFDGTLASFDAKWESFSKQVNAQFRGNKDSLALGGIVLKKLFARHLKQYGHIKHTKVAKVKHTIPKLKWKTKENFHDCGIFPMLHMETFDGGPALNLDCGLPVESQLQRDMLRRPRFKFATKILLHEINVQAGKMLELAKEFDKTDPVEKMAIIVDAFKKREERECI